MQLEKVQEIIRQKMINKKIIFILNMVFLVSLIYSFYYYQEVKGIVSRESNTYIVKNKYSPGRGVNYIIVYNKKEYIIEAQGNKLNINSKIELIYSDKYDTFFYPNNSKKQEKYICGIIILIVAFNLIVFKKNK